MRALLAAAALVLTINAAHAEPIPAPHYQIELALDVVAHALEADVALRLPPHDSDQPETFLLGAPYAIVESSAAPGVSIVVAPGPGPGAPQTITVAREPRRRGEAITVRLRYSGPLMETAGVNAIEPDRIELSADALWYPLSTNFNTRVGFDADIRGAPRDLIFVSPDRVRRSHGLYHIHRDIPSQDIAFHAAADLHRQNLGRLHLYARDLNAPQVRNYAQNGPRALAFLESMLGPCPRSNLAVVVADRASGVGYSRPGYVVVANVTRQIASDDYWVIAGYIAHELSHAWWSNANFTTEDYWLVESTAEYVALRFIEAIYGADARTRLLNSKETRAARGGALIGNGRASDDAVYARGPILLVQLEQQIGRPALDEILRTLAQRDAITTADFLASLAAHENAALAQQFEEQLRAP